MYRHNDEGAEYEGEEEEQALAADNEDDEEIQVLEDGAEDEEVDIERDMVTLLPQMDADRVQRVVKQHLYVVNYEYDTRAEKWCQLTLKVRLYSLPRKVFLSCSCQYHARNWMLTRSCTIH